MADWEFLLQKEGDRSWLPLDSPEVEILEGRYRIVVRSEQTNTQAEVRISHLATQEMPPKRRVQKRTRRTNAEGLMVVAPYTRLEPGIWEFQCSSPDLMSDLVGEPWKYLVKLHVLPSEAHSDDWEPDWSQPQPPEIEDQTPSSSSADFHSPEPQVAIFAQSQPTQTQPDQTQPIPTQPLPVPEVTVIDHPLPASAVASDSTTPTPLPQKPVTIEDLTALSPEMAQLLNTSMDHLMQLTEQMSDQLLSELLRDFDLAELVETPVAETPAPESATAPQPLPAPPQPVPSPVTNFVAEPALAPEISAVETDAAVSTTPTSRYALPAGASFALNLDQESLTASQGKALTLSGRVDVLSHTGQPLSHEQLSSGSINEVVPDPWSEVEPSMTKGAVASELQICLRDPQSLQVLVSDRQPLSSQAPPFLFSFTFTLPEHLSTHLILGEVLLCGSMPTHADLLVVLTTQPFTVTADPTELTQQLSQLNTMLANSNNPEAEQGDLPAHLATLLHKENATSPIDLSFLNLVANPGAEKPPEPTPAPEITARQKAKASLELSFLQPESVEASAPQPVTFAFASGQPLPPQLYRPDPAQVKDKRLDLPTFSQPGRAGEHGNGATPTQAVSEAVADSVPSPAAIAALEATVAPLPSESLPAPEPTLLETTPTLEQSTPSPSPGNANPAAESLQIVPANPAPAGDRSKLDLPSPTYMAFRALNLQERFLTRLTSLAADAKSFAEEKKHQFAGNSAPVMPEIDPRLAQEIVVNDEPMPSRNGRQNGSKPSSNAAPESSENPLLLPQDDPVPTPTLQITTGELVAGKLVNIRVRLPDLLPRIYVKLWVNDCQTRSLLEGPRWLTDFLPNGHGELEAFTQLTVPPGSLNIRFEAIAVEMSTQRESHKASVERAVVPPDLPAVALDEFDSSSRF